MSALERHLEWTTPAPLWQGTGDPQDSSVRRRFRTPAILRFANDDFMDEFLDLLNAQPNRLSEYVALPETWTSPPGEPTPPPHKTGLALKLTRLRTAAVKRLEARGSLVPGASALSFPSAPVKGLKLYQPAHQRFYLISACLVCRTVGLPDRRLDIGAQERVTFVMRMLQPHANANRANPDPLDCDELALVGTQWVPVSSPDSLMDGETQNALSPAAFLQDDQRTRRLFIGVVPVGQRESFLQASQTSGASQPIPIDPRQMLLKTQVIAPWKGAEDIAKAAYATSTSTAASANPQPAPAQLQAIFEEATDRIQAISFYILLDLARYLSTYLPSLWDAIQNNTSGTNLPGPQQTILGTLTQTTSFGLSMKIALRQAFAAADQLENVKTRYASGDPNWPNFHFLFSKATTAGVQGLQPALTRDVFEAQIVAALPPNTSNLPKRATAVASANPQGPVWFTIRCVLERPNCPGLSPALLSDPTVAFQLAAFFDSDAPARPIRIGLPIDTTPAGLRKFDKNTAFVMSDTLCGQVNKMSGMSFADLVLSVLPFPFHKGLDTAGGAPCSNGGVSFGMVCSFSIPIITICALILLIIFIKLLDIIFFWMPFFQICLPLPKFSAKDS